MTSSPFVSPRLAVYSASALLALASLVSCEESDDILVTPVDGCTPARVVEAFSDERSPEGGIVRARLRDDCLEVVWACCFCALDEVRATRSPLAVSPPIYIVDAVLEETAPGVNCVISSPDSTSVSLELLRRADPEFDLTFEGVPGLVIEVR